MMDHAVDKLQACYICKLLQSLSVIEFKEDGFLVSFLDFNYIFYKFHELKLIYGWLKSI